MKQGGLVEVLVAGTDSDVADAVAKIRQVSPAGRGRSDLIQRLGAAFASSSLLSKRAQAARYRLALLTLRPTDEEFLQLAGSAADLPAHLRVTLAEIAPERLQHHVYGVPRLAKAPEGPTSEVALLSSPQGTPLPSDHRGNDRTEHASLRGARVQILESSRRPVFVLVSHADYHEPNRNILEKSVDLDVVAVDSMHGLAALLNTDLLVCGFAIDESVLRTLAEAEQRELLTTVAEYSTFAPIRIHDSALLLGQDEVTRMIKECRRLRTPVPSEALSFESDRTIRGAELRRYELAAGLLRADARAFLVFEDVSESEAGLLAAAIRSRADAERVEAEPMPAEARIRFLSGGRSGARLLTISATGCPTLVAKVTSKALAREEVHRYRTFMRRWEPHLNPQCYYHGNTGVILSALVRDATIDSGVAQPLERVLAELWNREFIGADGELLDREGDLVALALRNAARGLADLNKQDPPNAEDLPAFVDAPGTHLNTLEQRGIGFGMNEAAVRALRLAAARYRGFPQQAIVHGDVHLQNVLRRGPTEAQWIDFASTTLAHPAVDLVRFELALYLGPMRQFASFSACLAFQRLFTIDRAPIEVLMERCPDHFACRINRACVDGMIEARNQVLEVVRLYGGDARDYWATKLLLAWQHLALIGSNTGLARAVVAAIAVEIDR